LRFGSAHATQVEQEGLPADPTAEVFVETGA
jgi:hypothetical protein